MQPPLRYRSPTDPIVRLGAANSCPFCLGRQHINPKIGDRIALLNGYDVGQRGTVDGAGWPHQPDSFSVRMDYERGEARRIVRPDLDLFVDPKFLTPPTWMPPLSVEDTLIIHEAALRAVELGLAEFQGQCVLIGTCWSYRLPLTGDELWGLLNAHGADSKARPVLVDRFQFGTGLLVGTHGRPPVKKRRMAALSKTRYLTTRQKELRQRLFGYSG